MKSDAFLHTFFQKRPISTSLLSIDCQKDYKISSHRSFNGKEKDSESGFHYYGARYYWSETLTGWLSVDPMTDKYPGISPYHYCHWNPSNLVDPDGKEDVNDWYKDAEGRLRWNSSVTKDTPLKNGEEYLGKTVLLTSGDGQTLYGDENGELHTSVPLPEVSIIRESETTEMEANIALPISFGAILFDNLSTIAGAAFEQVVEIAWMIPACLLFSGDSSPHQKVNGKNERHGDGERAKAKSDKQVEDLERQLQNAPKKERKKIENKIKNIKRDAEKKKKGEEHSRANKR